MNNLINFPIYLKLPRKTNKEEDLDSIEILDIDSEIEDEEEFDYEAIRGCMSFWIATVDDSGIDMLEQKPVGFDFDAMTMHYDTKEEMEKDFISLTEFLAKAEFIGRRWRYPGFDEVANFINKNDDRTALYRTDQFLLVQNNQEFLGPMFDIMLYDNEFDLPNRTLFEKASEADVYKDKGYTYKAVLDYLIRNKKKKL